MPRSCRPPPTTPGATGATELWLVTTNDNLPALAVYQQCGFRLAELRQGAVDRARTVKPSIPLVGAHGIGLHDELVCGAADQIGREVGDRRRPDQRHRAVHLLVEQLQREIDTTLAAAPSP